MSDVLRQLRQQHSTADARPRLMERYAAFLPVSGSTPNITLGEGYTPLVHARNLGRMIGCPLLYLKVEGINPTGSFKDRGMVVAVAKAMEEGRARSSAHRPAIRLLRPRRTAPRPGSMSWSSFRRARSRRASCSRHRWLEPGWWRSMATSMPRCTPSASSSKTRRDTDHRVTLVNSVNPHRMAGQKTAAFEICEDLGGAPDYLAIPVGNAGNITAYWQGFTDYSDAGMVETRPVMLGFQAAGRRAARAAATGGRSRTPWRRRSASAIRHQVARRFAPAMSRAA